MLRWPFRRTPDRPPPPAPTPEAAPEPPPPALGGVFPWPFDPLYRPTVCLFVDRRPVAVAPTFRVPGLGGEAGASWPCAFSFPLAAVPAGSRLVRCMETGAEVPLGDAPHRPAPASLDVDAIIALAQARQAAPDRDGFPDFLALTPSEQLSLVYHVVLARGVDDAGRATYLPDLADGTITILDIRDMLLGSEEFRVGQMPALQLPRGQWMVWGGLREAAPALIPRREAGGVGLADDVLARLALGARAEPASRQSWLAAQGEALARLRPVNRPEPPKPTPGGPMRFGALLADAATGVAGSRVGTTRIDVRDGVAGGVVALLDLPGGSGSYVATLQLAVAAATPPAARLTAEVVCGDALVARQDIAPADVAGGEPVRVRFALPADRPAGWVPRLRVSTDGAFAGSLTGLTLRREGRTGTEGMAGPRVPDWMALLAPGPAGRRTGSSLESPAESTGLVFDGPGCALLPGAYRARVALATEPGAGCAVTLSAGAAGVAREVQATLGPGEARTVTVPFTLLPGPGRPPVLAIALRKHEPAGLVVTAVTVERGAPGGDPLD